MVYLNFCGENLKKDVSVEHLAMCFVTPLIRSGDNTRRS